MVAGKGSTNVGGLLWGWGRGFHFSFYIYALLPEAEFLNVKRTEVLKLSSLPFTVTSFNGFFPPPLEQNGLKLGCNVKIVYGNLKSENSQDYAQKPLQNCTLMNSASAALLLWMYTTDRHHRNHASQAVTTDQLSMVNSFLTHAIVMTRARPVWLQWWL